MVGLGEQAPMPECALSGAAADERQRERQTPHRPQRRRTRLSQRMRGATRARLLRNRCVTRTKPGGVPSRLPVTS